MADTVTMDKIVSLCRRRGFVFPSSEIYGGLGSSYDYGHYGVLLKDNVKAAWLRAMVQEREDILALDSSIILHPQVWEASGHVGGFSDPLVDCRTCKQRFRADKLDEEQLRQAAEQAPGRDLRLRPDRAAPVQPHVQDARGRGRGDGHRRLPAPGDGAGHLHQLQERRPDRAPQAAVRDRAGRQVVPQRDHARQLHLPDARVRADGDGVLRAAGRGERVVPLLGRRAARLARAARRAREPPARAPARRRRALALLERDERHRVPLPDRLVGARGDREPRRLRPDCARRLVREGSRVGRRGHRRALRAARDRAGARRQPLDAHVPDRRLRRGGRRRARADGAAAASRSSRR